MSALTSVQKQKLNAVVGLITYQIVNDPTLIEKLPARTGSTLGPSQDRLDVKVRLQLFENLFRKHPTYNSANITAAVGFVIDKNQEDIKKIEKLQGLKDEAEVFIDIIGNVDKNITEAVGEAHKAYEIEYIVAGSTPQSRYAAAKIAADIINVNGNPNDVLKADAVRLSSLGATKVRAASALLPADIKNDQSYLEIALNTIRDVVIANPEDAASTPDGCAAVAEIAIALYRIEKNVRPISAATSQSCEVAAEIGKSRAIRLAGLITAINLQTAIDVLHNNGAGQPANTIYEEIIARANAGNGDANAIIIRAAAEATKVRAAFALIDGARIDTSIKAKIALNAIKDVVITNPAGNSTAFGCAAIAEVALACIDEQDGEEICIAVGKASTSKAILIGGLINAAGADMGNARGILNNNVATGDITAAINNKLGPDEKLNALKQGLLVKESMKMLLSVTEVTRKLVGGASKKKSSIKKKPKKRRIIKSKKPKTKKTIKKK
jgi:hypothetical protein